MRCAEYGGYLYIHSGRTMYKHSDGLNHQANITLQLRAGDTGGAGVIETAFSQGSVSHSFDQFILVDADRNMVTLDVGDGHPRAIAVIRFDAAMNGETLGDGSRGSQDWYNIRSESHIWDIPGQTGNNNVRCNMGSFAETSTGYVSAFCRDDDGAGFASRKLYMGYTAKDGLQSSCRLVSPEHTLSAPHLAPTGLGGGWILWNTMQGANGFYPGKTLQYASYSADGSIGEIRTAKDAPLSDCAPIQYNGKTVWYVTDDSAPTFYTLDASGVTATPAGGAAQTVQPAQPDAQPGTSGGGLFQDVSPSHWAYQDIAACTEAGIINGFGDGVFKPARNISYAEFASMLTRTLYGDELQAAQQQKPAGAQWYYPNMKVLQDKSLDRGTSLEGGGWSTYAGNAISRYQMAVLLNNAMEDQNIFLRVASRLNNLYLMGEIQKTLPSDFTSQWTKAAKASIADWNSIPEEYGEAVAQCYAFGALAGMSDGSFSGSGPMTRAQACVVIQRLKGLAEGRLPAGHFWLQ